MKTTFKYDHYYKYEELKSNLEYFAKTYPDLVDLDVNTVTPEGRNQYAVTLTNKNTGPALSKPGWYLDGNIHAGEVTASMAAMHTLDYLLTNHEEQDVQQLLDSTTIYIIPRISVDGAEKYLSTPYVLRSAPRDYNVVEGGVRSEDLDQDGVIRMMRIPTPYGAWKKDSEHEGCMVKREPDDIFGTFYDIYPEGVLDAYEGDENLKKAKDKWGNDFNRNFPLGWFPDSRQGGAGAYPLCNPETKGIVDFVLAHPNIGGAAIGHTSGGMLLYPPGTRSSTSVSFTDIKAFKEIAAMGEKALGYVSMNIFDSFMSDQTNYDSGAEDDWFYQAQGIPAYTVEFWDVSSKAGVPHVWNGKPEDPAKALERFNAIMNWVKQNVPQYYKDWTEFEHPVFGKVEIGGFNMKYTIQNPPENMLCTECENDTKFNISFAKAMPRLTVESVEASKVSEGIYAITAVVGNLGYLPTNLTEEAISLHVNTPVEVTLKGAEVVNGTAQIKIGDLSGYSRTATGAFYGNLTTFKNAEARRKVKYVVKAEAGTVLTVQASQAKAGTAEYSITLK